MDIVPPSFRRRWVHPMAAADRPSGPVHRVCRFVADRAAGEATLEPAFALMAR